MQRRAERASGASLAREISIPLPLKGLLVEAKSAEVSGLYAGELMNWKSTGVSLRTRSIQSPVSGGGSAWQRIPFEFGQHQQFVRVQLVGTETDTVAGGRTMAAPVRSALISSNLIMVDGAAAPQLYDGNAFSASAFTTDTGIAPATFDGVLAHQDRPFFWKEGDGLDFYYGDVGAIGGGLSRFPLGRLGNITGKIVCMKSLTIDAGHGMNDTLAIFTSTGKIVCYEGLDPSDAQDWRQVNRITAAAPISPDAFIEVGADVWMLTAAGVVSVNSTLANGALALVNTISRPVREKLTEQLKEGGDWSMHLSADASSVIINRVFNGVASQFIYRTDTKAWDETDFPAAFWHNLGLETYFTGLDGKLYTMDGGSGTAMTARWVSSWFRLPRSGAITGLVPTILARGALDVSVTLLSDHDETSGDIAEATQTVRIDPDDPADPGGRVSLNEMIAVDAVGDVFQITLEVTAEWAEMVSLKAWVQ